MSRPENKEKAINNKSVIKDNKNKLIRQHRLGSMNYRLN